VTLLMNAYCTGKRLSAAAEKRVNAVLGTGER
jgi:hypothetical protein